MFRLKYLFYFILVVVIAVVVFCIVFFTVRSKKEVEVEVAVLRSPRSYCATRGHWDENTQSLYYVDIEGPDATLLRYDFAEQKTYSATMDDEPILTFILPVVNTTDEFLVGTQNRAILIQWDGKSTKGQLLRSVFEIPTDFSFKPNRFNGAKADPIGNFVGGTQYANDCLNHSTTAYLYHYNPIKGLTTIRSNLFISNGLTWSEKTNKLYYIDSCVPKVSEFDYDIATGSLSNERIAYSTSPDIVLDGLTNDNDGNLYITTFGGSKVFKVDPVEGKLLQEIEFPAKQVTSVAFGGPNFDILFVTTAARGDDQPEAAGYLYQVTGLNSIGSAAMKVNV
ncbi:Regucalcin [Pseudolycoriella hygida]|uniref:Regucalcin n=1 Tax=Pseudolycoriella hygida TaxID=35572 RepID=A0A9Q0NFL7_9DIPT|nr:Regucalcin [Pseudolycoriella hygida]